MIRLNSTTVRESPIEWEDRSVTLVGRQWMAGIDTRFGAVGATYHQPLRAEIVGEESAVLPIRDHVMLARIAFAVLVMAAVLIRRTRR